MAAVGGTSPGARGMRRAWTASGARPGEKGTRAWRPEGSVMVRKGAAYPFTSTCEENFPGSFSRSAFVAARKVARFSPRFVFAFHSRENTLGWYACKYP